MQENSVQKGPTGGRTAKGIRTANGIYSNMARKCCVILGTINPTLAY